MGAAIEQVKHPGSGGGTESPIIHLLRSEITIYLGAEGANLRREVLCRMGSGELDTFNVGA